MLFCTPSIFQHCVDPKQQKYNSTDELLSSPMMIYNNRKNALYVPIPDEQSSSCDFSSSSTAEIISSSALERIGSSDDEDELSTSIENNINNNANSQNAIARTSMLPKIKLFIGSSDDESAASENPYDEAIIGGDWEVEIVPTNDSRIISNNSGDDDTPPPTEDDDPTAIEKSASVESSNTDSTADTSTNTATDESSSRSSSSSSSSSPLSSKSFSDGPAWTGEICGESVQVDIFEYSSSTMSSSSFASSEHIVTGSNVSNTDVNNDVPPVVNDDKTKDKNVTTAHDETETAAEETKRSKGGVSLSSFLERTKEYKKKNTKTSRRWKNNSKNDKIMGKNRNSGSGNVSSNDDSNSNHDKVVDSVDSGSSVVRFASDVKECKKKATTKKKKKNSTRTLKKKEIESESSSTSTSTFSTSISTTPQKKKNINKKQNVLVDRPDKKVILTEDSVIVITPQKVVVAKKPRPGETPTFVEMNRKTSSASSKKGKSNRLNNNNNLSKKLFADTTSSSSASIADYNITSPTSPSLYHVATSPRCA